MKSGAWGDNREDGNFLFTLCFRQPMNSQLSFSFSIKRENIQRNFTEHLKHRMALKPALCEADNIGPKLLTASAKTETMIRGPEDRRSIISTTKLLRGRRKDRSLRQTRLLVPWTYCPQQF
jgi:hypothetical protein